jgi:hypothetical protein
MAGGNPEHYNFNSHTSIAHYNGIKGRDEDKWNKWEYDVDSEVLECNTLNTKDDRKIVIKKIKQYFKGKDLSYMRNIQNRNSGNRNSGNRNSGNRNSGNRNSGNRNSGNGVFNHFCTKTQYLLFDVSCSKEEAEKVYNLDLWRYVKNNTWVHSSEMTEEEKEVNKNHTVTGGYLKTISLKESWKAVPKNVLEQIRKLKNFNADKFEIISGIKLGNAKDD